METSKHILASTFAATFAALAVHAKTTLYVDDDNYNASCASSGDYRALGFDGSTEAKAFGTIQAAIDSIPAGTASEYNEIIVLPGTYDKGVTNAVGGNTTYGNCRIWFYWKGYIYLHSSGGKDVTHIVGALDPDTVGTAKLGCGDNAVKGICNHGSTGVRIEGFTIRNCASDYTAAEIQGSSALVCQNGRNVFVNDCVVSNCAAYYGIVYHAEIFRTMVCDNRNIGAGILFRAQACNSIFTRNKCSSVVSHSSTVVNSTIVNNDGRNAIYSTSHAYNSIITASCSTEIASDCESTDCALESACGELQTIAPMINDFRVLKGGMSETAADASNLNAALFVDGGETYFPTAWLHRDINGNEIAQSGTIMAGAIQEAIEPAGGAIVLSGVNVNDGVTVDSFNVLKNGMYAYPVKYPVQWRIKLTSLADTRFFRGMEDTGHAERAVPGMDGTVWLTPPPDANVCMTSTVAVVQWPKVYVDDTNGDDTTADGTEAKPFKTIQGAILATNQATIMVKPGWYDKGGEVYAGISNRVCIAADTHNHTLINIVSTDGPEHTFIVGAPDPDHLDDAEAPGCGPAAVRCVSFQTTQALALRGFTLVDGHTDGASGTTAGQHGAAITTQNGQTHHFCDLVISNCVGYASIMNRGVLARSRMVGCMSAFYGLHNACSRSCEFSGNAAALSFFAGNNMYQCHATMVQTNSAQSIFSTQRLFNSIIVGGNSGGATDYGNSIFYDWTAYAPAMRDYVNTNPFLADAKEGDFRIVTGSPAIGLGVTAKDSGYSDVYKWTQGDVKNKAIVFTDGRPTVGAWQTPIVGAIVRIFADKGGLAVTGAEIGAETVLLGGETLTLTRPAGSRLCSGFTVNGTTNLFKTATSFSFTCSDDWNGSFDIDAIYLPKGITMNFR